MSIPLYSKNKIMTKICLNPGSVLYRMKMNLIREVYRKLMDLMKK